MKDDLDTALYLLPYLVFDILAYGTKEDRTSIKEEFLAVLQASANLSGENSELNEMSAQRVFFFIDWLSKWTETQKRLSQSQPNKSNSKRTKGKDQWVYLDFHFTQFQGGFSSL